MDRENDIALPPKFFGRELRSHLLDELRRQVEGQCTGQYGFTILVTNIKHFSQTGLDEDTGWAHFCVQYHALVFRPFRNQVLPAEVLSLNAVSGF